MAVIWKWVLFLVACAALLHAWQIVRQRAAALFGSHRHDLLAIYGEVDAPTSRSGWPTNARTSTALRA